MAGVRPRAGLAVVALPARLVPGDLPALCDALRATLAATGAGTITCDVRAVVLPDAVIVDALARLALTARRAGCRLEVRGASPRLRDLLAFAGLAGELGLQS